MSHVDEGTLHAWLDGALDALPAVEAARVREHLAECEECRARLEEERAIRQEAADILGAASPGMLDAPAFEELRARASARGRPGRVSARVYRLGWAASVVLALGAGWMLRDATVPDFGRESLDKREAAPAGGAASEEAARPAPAAAPADAEALRDAAGDVAGVAARAPAGAPSGALAPERLAVEEERAGTRAAGAQPVAVDEARREPGAAPGAEPEAVGGAEARPPTIPRADEPLLRDPALLRDKMIVAPLPAPRFDTLSFPRSAAEAKEAAAAAARPQPAADSPVALDAIARRRVTQVGDVGQVVSTAIKPVVSRPAAPAAETGAAGNAVVSGAGLVLADPASLVVPGLALISMDPLDREGLPGAMRVRQRMADGDTLEVVRLPAGLSPAALAPVERDGRTELVLPRDGGWLVVRAHADRDTLLALVRRMGGGR